MAAFLKTVKSLYLSDILTDRHYATLSILRNEIANIIKRNGFSFSQL